MIHLKPEHERKMRELLDQPVFDGGDAGELVNERARAERYERILAQVADVLGCPQDFGMILPNLLRLKRQDDAQMQERMNDYLIEMRAARERFEGRDGDNATHE